MGEPKYKPKPIAPATFTVELFTETETDSVKRYSIPFQVPRDKGGKMRSQIMLHHTALQLADKEMQNLTEQHSDKLPDRFWTWVKDDRGSIVTKRSAEGKSVIYQAFFARGADGVLKPQMGKDIVMPQVARAIGFAKGKVG